jgi:hypothetical protein
MLCRSTAVVLIEAGCDREKANLDDQTAEQMEGLGLEAQKKIRQFVWSKVGKPDQ